jgi:UPF0755 protein
VSVRDGRSPRDPYDPEQAPPGTGMPTWRASDGHGNPPRVRPRLRRADATRRERIPSFVKFLAFSGVLAAVVLVTGLTVLRPVARAAVTGWAWDNPTALKLPFVADLVREDLGDALTAPNPGSSDETIFTVESGDTLASLAARLKAGGYITDERAFIFQGIQDGLGPLLKAGDFVLRGDMTLTELQGAILTAKLVVQSVDVTFREGIRLEQMTALLSTIDSKVDAAAYYDLVKHPPATLLADFPWLAAAGLPDGASLEGFLFPATYTLVTGSNGGPVRITDAASLVRMQLTKFYDEVGPDRMAVPESRGMTFYEVVTLASIVDHETAAPAERALVAGVYQNRLDGYKGVAKVLNADPTVIWAVDTATLADLPLDQWKDFYFWEVPKTKMADVKVPKALQGYQTYQVAGLIPGPISTPTVAAIDAALKPDTASGYLYFVAIPNTGTHAFAKTLAEHTANLKKYGYL